MLILILCIFLLFFCVAGDFWLAACYTLWFVPAAIIAICIHAIEPNFWPFVGAAFAIAAMFFSGVFLYAVLFPPKKRHRGKKLTA